VNGGGGRGGWVETNNHFNQEEQKKATNVDTNTTLSYKFIVQTLPYIPSTIPLLMKPLRHWGWTQTHKQSDHMAQQFSQLNPRTKQLRT